MRTILCTTLFFIQTGLPALAEDAQAPGEPPLCADITGKPGDKCRVPGIDVLCRAPGQYGSPDHVLYWRPLVMDASCCTSAEIDPAKTDRAHAQGAVDLLLYTEDPHYHITPPLPSADISAAHLQVMRQLQAPLPDAPALRTFRDKRAARYERLYRLNLAEAQARERNSYAALAAHPDVKTLCTQEFAQMRASGTAHATLGVGSAWTTWRYCMLDEYRDFATYQEKRAAYDAFRALFTRMDEDCIGNKW